MVYPFESAAYNTPVGEVSNPIRSNISWICSFEIIQEIPDDDGSPTRQALWNQFSFMYGSDS